jgi:hypothetical protein
MKKIIALLIACFAITINSMAQSDSTFRLIKKIQADIVDFTTDNLDNIYILNSRNQLKKLDANGDSVAIFNDIKKYGKATLIDVSNPLKIVLYYKDFATVVMLDRFLNVRNTIDLRKQNILQAKALGQSFDNKIWLYDELENKLKKIDEEGKLLLETPDFRLLMGRAISPIKIFDENKYVYVYDSLSGVYVFDYFGGLKNNILIQRWQNFKVSGNYIFGSKSDTLYRYEISSFQFDEWKMPEQINQSASFSFSANRMYALKKDKKEKSGTIFIYSIR